MACQTSHLLRGANGVRKIWEARIHDAGGFSRGVHFDCLDRRVCAFAYEGWHLHCCVEIKCCLCLLRRGVGAACASSQIRYMRTNPSSFFDVSNLLSHKSPISIRVFSAEIKTHISKQAFRPSVRTGGEEKKDVFVASHRSAGYAA